MRAATMTWKQLLTWTLSRASASKLLLTTVCLKKGPGRADDGNFVLSELKFQWANATANKETEVAKWNFEKDAAEWKSNDQVTLANQGNFLQVTSSGNDPQITREVKSDGKLFMLEVQAKLNGTARVTIVLEYEQ